ncbi:MAG TPA: AzlC family ABC transporter permease, partial [Aestuariivirga sp.]|nr:AzlC family ABC transporter permease [Aestuariivirga sp.]
MARRDEIWAGVRDMAPILVAAAPIGLLWGTLAAGKGLSALEAWLMSVFVFAGASQFVAIDLWQTPVDVFVVALAVFIVNLRHILMAASLSRQVGAVKPALVPLMAYVLVDEAWALSERR